MQEQVFFLDSNNNKFELKYYEIFDFCKEICEKNENREKFLEFKKDYKYFSAYFDYVVFELGYILVGGLLEKGNYLVPVDNALYSIRYEDDEKISYQDLIDVASRTKKYKISYITKSSDSELDIKQYKNNDKPYMVDSNGIAMMSHNGVADRERGCHIVTSQTILNQLLIQSRESVEIYLTNKCDPIDFLTKIGFTRILSKEEGNLAVGIIDTIPAEIYQKISKTKGLKFHNFKKLIPLTKDSELTMKEEYERRR